MDKIQINQYPDWLTSTLASDASGGKGALPLWIRVLEPGSRVVGPAFVAAGSKDDNLIARRVADEAHSLDGVVLVIGGQSGSDTATVGNLIALEFQKRGVIALVTDGLVRDSKELILQGFSVWCRGVTPISSAKVDRGAIGEPIIIGGVLIREGDLVIGDDDGIVIWPKENIEELLRKAKERFDIDTERFSRLTSMK